jgi:hypothetical protein
MPQVEGVVGRGSEEVDAAPEGGDTIMGLRESVAEPACDGQAHVGDHEQKVRRRCDDRKMKFGFDLL